MPEERQKDSIVMGKIIKEHVTWVLAFLSITTGIMTAAIIDIRNDIDNLHIKMTTLEVYIHGIEKRPYGRKPITLEHSGVDETQAR